MKVNIEFKIIEKTTFFCLFIQTKTQIKFFFNKMKFGEHLSSHLTPEWISQYIKYEALKEIL